MAYNTKQIVTDKDGNPISQYYNPTTDSYEPVEGVMGANKVTLVKSDGTENNDLNLTPILDKLTQLTGTAIDEETRKQNEIIRELNEEVRVENEDARLVFEVYDNSVSYKKGNKVVYQGSSYVCIEENIGKPPTNTDYWLLIAKKGDKGERGSDGITTTIDGQFGLEIREDGNLWLVYTDGEIPPDFHINNDGELILTL